MNTISVLDVSKLDEGPFLVTHEPKKEAEWAVVRDFLPGLAPWGTAKNLASGMEIVTDGDGKAILFNDEICWRSADRGLFTRKDYIHNCEIKAVVKPDYLGPLGIDGDNIRTGGPLIGIVFRCKTIRSYYQFGVLNKDTLVLYCRQNDNLYTLARQEIGEVDDYLTLQVKVNDDEIECSCPEKNVSFTVRDDTYSAGAAGVRSYKRGYLRSLEVRQDEEEGILDEEIKRMSFMTMHSYALAEEELQRTFDVSELGGKVRFNDVAEEGRYDLLISKENSFELKTVDGETIWTMNEPLEYISCSSVFTPQGRLLYGLSGKRTYNEQIINDVVLARHESLSELVVIEGKTGNIIGRRKAPPPAGKLNCYLYSIMSGKLSSAEGTDIIFREYRDDKANAGTRLWAFDKHLNELWYHDQEGYCWYGHAAAVDMADVNNDGWDEVLAGGFLYDRHGNILWIHDRNIEALEWPRGSHYDSACLVYDRGDWRAFMVGSSAGVYIANAQNGRTLKVYRDGHTQHHIKGNFRDDLPGEEVLIANHHGSNGYVFLLAANGDKLWEAQPDYNHCIGHPIEWGGRKVIWFGSSEECQCFYDGYGKKIKDLGVLKNFYQDQGFMSRSTITYPVRLGTDPRTLLALQSLSAGKIHIFGY